MSDKSTPKPRLGDDPLATLDWIGRKPTSTVPTPPPSHEPPFLAQSSRLPAEDKKPQLKEVSREAEVKPPEEPATAEIGRKRQTFYLEPALIEKLHDFAYWERRKISDVVNEALNGFLENWNRPAESELQRQRSGSQTQDTNTGLKDAGQKRLASS